MGADHDLNQINNLSPPPADETRLAKIRRRLRQWQHDLDLMFGSPSVVSEQGRLLLDAATALESIDDLRAAHDRLQQEKAKADDDAEYWMLVADGIKHSHLCPNNVASGPHNEHRMPCDRCRTEASEAELTTLRAQVTQLQAALNEVVTNGEWQGGTDWCISTAVYETATDALGAQKGDDQ